MKSVKVFSIQLWDVGGSALDGRMLDKYVFGANAILLVYDVSNYNSFENLEGWLLACKKVGSETTMLTVHGGQAIVLSSDP